MLPDLNQLKLSLMLPQLFNSSVETLLNYLLQRSPHYQTHLRKLKGKILSVCLQKWEQPLYFVFSSQRIDILGKYEGDADCEIKIAANLLFNAPKKAEISRYINDQSIQLQGDLQVLQDFVTLMEFIEKDPAELLSPYLGDVVAHSAVSFLQNLQRNLKQRFTQSQRYWGERLTEEWQVISPSAAIEDFCQQVKILEKDTALLEQRFNQIIHK